jgi:serine phosphatase RsbU (regulator of sigma subunit)
MSLSTRFTLFMTLALTVVMAIAGAVLYNTAAKVTSTVQERTLIDAVRLTGKTQKADAELRALETERALLIAMDKRIGEAFPAGTEVNMVRTDLIAMLAERTAKLKNMDTSGNWRQVEGQEVFSYDDGRIKRFPIVLGANNQQAYLLRYSSGISERGFDFLAPSTTVEAERGLLGLIIGIILVVIAVAALVSVLVARQVSGPIEAIADDLRQISTGDLNHTTRARGVREVNMLARSIDRMTTDLASAQEAQLELSVREREVELASEVRESLMANSTPKREGFEFGALCLSAPDLGGDFHDFILTQAGEVGLLVCDVSGRGLPGTLVGATARAYLRAELSRGVDLRQSLIQVNRELARDVRRGMYVSALYVLLNPKTNRAQIACAGHKLPLVHLAAQSGKARLVQPEGIALGFDQGPMFEGRLEIVELAVEPGDRLVVFNSGPAVLLDPEGAEYGEKHVYAQVQRHGARPTDEFLDRLRSVLEAHAQDTPLPRDVAILTAKRI